MVPLLRVNIDILECKLNRLLFGFEYEIPGAIPDLGQRMFTANQQRT